MIEIPVINIQDAYIKPWKSNSENNKGIGSYNILNNETYKNRIGLQGVKLNIDPSKFYKDKILGNYSLRDRGPDMSYIRIKPLIPKEAGFAYTIYH